jgi:hypothetical protein
MHIAKKKRITEKEKSHYGGLILETAALTPPRQHHKSNFFKSGVSKKGKVHKRCHCSIKDLDFHPEEGHRSQNNAFNKTIARHNQLRADLEFSL